MFVQPRDLTFEQSLDCAKVAWELAPALPGDVNQEPKDGMLLKRQVNRLLEITIDGKGHEGEAAHRGSLPRPEPLPNGLRGHSADRTSKRWSRYAAKNLTSLARPTGAFLSNAEAL
jgi:hypothetical protein